jgi:hypothetical protein
MSQKCLKQVAKGTDTTVMTVQHVVNNLIAISVVILIPGLLTVTLAYVIYKKIFPAQVKVEK